MDKRSKASYHWLGRLVLTVGLLGISGCSLFLRATPGPRADLDRWHLHGMAVGVFADLTRQGVGPQVAWRFAEDLRETLGSRVAPEPAPGVGLLTGRIFSYRLSPEGTQAWVSLTVRLWSSPSIHGRQLLWSRHLGEFIPLLPGESPHRALDRAIHLAAKEFASDFEP